MVIQQAELGPELCSGAIAASYPPQCRGTPIAEWDWTDVPHNRSQGTLWSGPHLVTGAFQGAEFRVDAIGEIGDAHRPGSRTRLTACDAPAEGWSVRDEARADDVALDEVVAAAASYPGFVASWMDRSTKPLSSDETLLGATFVVNLAYSGDIRDGTREAAAISERLQAEWGGALCVTFGAATTEQLSAIDDVAQRVAGDRFIESTRDSRSGVVNLVVDFDDGAMQSWFNSSISPGAVVVHSWFDEVSAS